MLELVFSIVRVSCVVFNESTRHGKVWISGPVWHRESCNGKSHCGISTDINI